MPLRTDALAPGLTAKEQPLQLSDPPPTHPSLSCDERSKPPVSRSGSAGGEQRVGSGTRNPPSATSAGPPPPQTTPLPSLLNLCFTTPALHLHTCKHTHTQRGVKKKKKKNCHGVFHQLSTRGSSLRLLHRRDSTDETPNTSTFCSSFIFLNSFFFFSLCHVSSCVA